MAFHSYFWFCINLLCLLQSSRSLSTLNSECEGTRRTTRCAGATGVVDMPQQTHSTTTSTAFNNKRDKKGNVPHPFRRFWLMRSMWVIFWFILSTGKSSLGSCASSGGSSAGGRRPPPAPSTQSQSQSATHTPSNQQSAIPTVIIAYF